MKRLKCWQGLFLAVLFLNLVSAPQVAANGGGSTTYYTVADYTTQDTTVIGNYVNQTINCPNGDFTHTENINVTFTAGQRVILRQNFDVSNGANAIQVIATGPSAYAVFPMEVTGSVTQIQ